jgi:hypothetical protein
MLDSPMRRKSCSVCPSIKIAARGLCWKHYGAWLKWGDPLFDRKIGPRQPKQSPNGYWRIGPDYLHRVTFELCFGIEGHTCFDCGRSLVWRTRKRSDTWGDTLVVHHADGDRSNNDPANLLPACASCNSRTHLAGRSYMHRDRCPNDHPLKGRNVYLRNGYMQCRVCHNKRQRERPSPPP